MEMMAPRLRKSICVVGIASSRLSSSRSRIITTFFSFTRPCSSSSSSSSSSAAAATADDSIEKQQQQQQQNLKGLRIGLTTPTNYAMRLVAELSKEGAEAIRCPTIAVERTPAILDDMRKAIADLGSFKGIAFTSRSGIASFAEARKQEAAAAASVQIGDPPLLVGALGKDAELIQELNLFSNVAADHVKLVVPEVATPDALVEALGQGQGRRLLCPVPLVMGLEEPPVVPNMLEALKSKGWDPVRVDAYITRWLGQAAAAPLLQAVGQEQGVDAVLLTSIAEVEGLLKSLDAYKLTLDNIRKCRRGKRCLFVAYGPVTAEGAAKLGVNVDLVGHEFRSFTDLVQLLVSHFKKPKS